LATIVLALWSVAGIVLAFHASNALGVLTLLVFAPLYFLVTMIFVRVGLEVVLVFFQIRDEVTVISTRVTASPEPVAAPPALP
jgi:hypothetical protein